jgi:hypothetical protein
MAAYLLSRGIEIFSFAYATLRSLKQVKSLDALDMNHSREMEKLSSNARETLMLWALLGLYMGSKSYWEFLLHWIPGYYYIKCIAMLLITFPQLRFTKVAFENGVMPVVEECSDQVEARGGVTALVSAVVFQAPFLFISFLFPFPRVLGSPIRNVDSCKIVATPQSVCSCPLTLTANEEELIRPGPGTPTVSALHAEDDAPSWFDMCTPDLQRAVRASSQRLSLLGRASRRITLEAQTMREPLSPLLPQPESVFTFIDDSGEEKMPKRKSISSDKERRDSLSEQIKELQKLHALPSSEPKMASSSTHFNEGDATVANENAENAIASWRSSPHSKSSPPPQAGAERLLSDALSNGRVSSSRRRR